MAAFLRHERGQDLIGYTLFPAFVALVADGLFIQSGQSTSVNWSIANTQLSSASSAASAS